MTSSNTFPRKWTKIDDLQRSDHWHLTEDDHCYFLGEYTARAGYKHSVTNNTISNFKKSPDRQELAEWRYKGIATRAIANSFQIALGDSIDCFTFVPVPPSKARDDPLYDDRLVKMLRQVRRTPPLDIRDMVVQTSSQDPSHQGGPRHPDDIANLYVVDELLAGPVRQWIAIVDDLLTTGGHFKAMQKVLSDYFPDVPILGFFAARRVPNADEVWI